MCANCMASRRIGLSGERREGSKKGGEEEEGREGSVVQGTVYLSERIVEDMGKEYDDTTRRMWRESMGLGPSVVLSFLRERLRWIVWTVRT